MKKLIYVVMIPVLFAVFLISPKAAKANWISTNNTLIPNTLHIQDIKDTPSTQNDSLPEGVSQDWLNNLRDENGNRIMISEDLNHQQEDPEGDAFQKMTFTGFGSNYSFGKSVSSAGDLNGDGYDDIIVGASGFNTNTGRAYIYYGGLIMNAVADVVLTGESTNSYFGYSVSVAGDVNGDGYSDVIVGAYGFSSNTGRAYVYYGGSVMNNTADVIMTGESTSSNFGISVSSAGDVNSDGYADAVVGAYTYSSNTGRVYIYYGGSVMNNTSDVIFNGESSLSYFGFSVSSAGDVNSDGYSDVIIGAFGNSSYRGKVYIYFGGSVMNNVADVIFTGEFANTNFGYSVSTAGDVNGDGYSDVIVGAYGYSSNTGRAYIFFGGSSMDNITDIQMTGESTSTGFGTSVSTAGDLNGDGYSDVIIGANIYSSNTGRAYIYFGGSLMNNISDLVITGETSFSSYGSSVSTAGDINGDGYSDLIIGASGYSGNTGRVYLYDYYLKSEITHDLSMTGETTSSSFGTSVSNAGDVNGDGYSDVIVGANSYSSNTGRAYIFFGGKDMNNIADVTMTGQTTNNYFGASVSSAGDVNGDGYSDVIVGAYLYSSNTGRAYIYFGGAAMNNVADVTMTGEANFNEFGSSVSSAGDVNGDGYSDVIVGAELYSAFNGRAYIYFGGAFMNNVADVTMTGETTDNHFGSSVSSAGDVNGDGYSDVIVGAYFYSSSTGRAYIYYGGTSMNNVADLTMTGEASGHSFGNSVSGAGDVNGDGYSDIIIGAYIYNTTVGRAYIYYGGASPDNMADVIFTGETASNYFGNSVSTAGDMNGDGYSDVIIGALGNTGSTGKAYVYFGGSVMNNTVDVIMKGEFALDNFGCSVSSAGDVNGDGYSDIISGAFGYNSYKGRSDIFLGSAISAKPILNYVKDVSNDQGGFVNLKWARSSFDVNGNDLVTGYSVYRSYPPSGGNFSWEEVGSVTAAHHSFYTLTTSTPYDSSSNSSGNFFFKVRAKTSNVNSYWETAILSGRSIDNIAPLMVSPFTAAASGPNVLLKWNRSAAPDLLNYVLFRNVNPTIDPNSETPWMTATDSTLLDTSPLTGSYYYFIVAQDIHGNYSPVAVAQSTSTILNLTMFVEGFYNAGSNSMISDTVTVQLRNSASPFAIADETKGVAASDGTVQLNFGNAGSGNYYIVLLHRNSVETWSSSPVSITSGGSVSYNFSTSASQAFGNNMKLADSSPLRFGIFSGDENQDGFVNLTDVVNVYNNAVDFVNGYVASDMNGDNVTDLTDIVITSNNASAFVSKIVP